MTPTWLDSSQCAAFPTCFHPGNLSLSALTQWTFQQMPRLRVLDVSQNRLAYLPAGIFQASSFVWRDVGAFGCRA